MALLVDEVLSEQRRRQWVLSYPFQLRFLFASRPEIIGRVLGAVMGRMALQEPTGNPEADKAMGEFAECINEADFAAFKK